MSKNKRVVIVFFLGSIFGIFLSELLSTAIGSVVHKTYADILRSMFQIDQSYKATKATENGDMLEALIHRKNVVDTYANEDSFTVFEKDGHNFSLLSACNLYLLKKIKKAHDSKIKRATEALERGKLAYAYDALEMKLKAEKEWEKAFELIDYKKERQNDFKKFVQSVLTSEIEKPISID